MTLLFNKLVNSLIQIILFGAIPFIWWYVTSRKSQSFWNWIGLKKMRNTYSSLLWIAGVSFVFIFFGASILYLLKDIDMATSEFAGLGVRAILPVFVYAVFNTAFSEELLFRGFLLKRIENKFGFFAGNTVQAVLFGLLHGVMFFPLAGVAKAVWVITVTGSIAWFMGYINERKAGGSILPSWITHALSNIFSGLCTAFL